MTFRYSDMFECIKRNVGTRPQAVKATYARKNVSRCTREPMTEGEWAVRIEGNVADDQESKWAFLIVTKKNGRHDEVLVNVREPLYDNVYEIGQNHNLFDIA